MRRFGLDGEMTAADPHAGGRLIQIGLAAHEDNSGGVAESPAAFSSLINPGEHMWDSRAAAVHGFTVEEILQAPTAEQVDAACVEWLSRHGVQRPRTALAIGFNVGAFDLPHIALVLPRTAGLFTRRTIDLNALCFTLEGRLHEGNAPTWSGWKRMATTYAERIIAQHGASSEAAHDAGYDALLHLHAWRYLRGAIQGNPLPMPQEATHTYARQVQAMTNRLLTLMNVAEATERTGYTADEIKGWANGGRVTDREVLVNLETAYRNEELARQDNR